MTRRLPRAAAAVALAGLAAVVPAVPAHACSAPTGYFDVDRDPLPAGGRVTLRGDVVADAQGRKQPCVMPPLPPPTPTPSLTEPASPEPDPGPSSIVTLLPLVPVAYAAPAAPVVVSIAEWRDWDEPPVTTPPRTLGSIAPNPNRWYAPGLLLWSFRGTVTIPADLRPGDYALYADQRGGAGYGFVRVTVGGRLADTGAPVSGLVRLALLSLLTGAGALAAARRVAR